MALLTKQATGWAAEFLSYLSLDLQVVQLVPLNNCLYKEGILELV